MGQYFKQKNKDNKMSKKILFMGTPDYATTILKELLQSKYEIIGRKQLLTPPHI